MIMTKTILCLL